MSSATQQAAPAADTRPALDIDALWSLDRVGAVALSPDGRQAVCSVTRGDMAANRSRSSLWLLGTDGAAPRQLTHCGDKDGAPAWSPRGDQIAFIARREQQGDKDATPQLYVIAPDGGEARRISRFRPGIESFKWLPDGRRIVFAAWVWPQLTGAAAQNRQHKAFGERKESGYVTSEAFYRYWDHSVPMGRVLHLLLLDLGSGRITDLFEGTDLQLPRDAPGVDSYDPSPDGRRVAFVHDPAPTQVLGNRLVLSELTLAGRSLRRLADDPDWEFAAPAYRGDGLALAMTAAQVGRRHTAFNQLALVGCGADTDTDTGWRLLGDPAWDHHVDAPLRWADGDRSLLFGAEERGRCHLWRHDLASGEVAIAFEGGWVQGFDAAAGQTLVVADSARHPAQVLAWAGTRPPRRLDSFNDKLLAGYRLGEVREQTVSGALGDAVQVWLTLPVGFDARKKHPLLQVIHGGPFAAAGDSFSYRWNPHLLAARGHVIAQVNYHGSSGFGFAFRDSIMGRQGDLETQDIEAASDWLARQRWVDATRISASGGSYGGFLVAWMNGHVSPGRYRSYVCHAGVFDRVATFSADSYPQRPLDLGALYWDDPVKVLGQSPHSGAGQMHTPTLVTHGALDYRVPDCNGLAYYNTLKARGVAARLLWFPDENHWVLKPQNSRLWYREFLDWVQAHDSPAAVRAAAGSARSRR